MLLRKLVRVRRNIGEDSDEEDEREVDQPRDLGASAGELSSSLPRELQNLLQKVLADQQIVDKIVTQESFKRIVQGQLAVEDFARSQYNLLADRARQFVELPDAPEYIPVPPYLHRGPVFQRYSPEEDDSTSFRTHLLVDDSRLACLCDTNLDMRSQEPIRVTLSGGWRRQGLSALLTVNKPSMHPNSDMSSTEAQNINIPYEDDEYESETRFTGGHAGSPPKRFWSTGPSSTNEPPPSLGQGELGPVVTAMVISVAAFALLTQSLMQNGHRELAERVIYWARKVGDAFVRLMDRFRARTGL